MSSLGPLVPPALIIFTTPFELEIERLAGGVRRSCGELNWGARPKDANVLHLYIELISFDG